MDEQALARISSVWRLDADLTVTRLFGEVGCANGTCFSPDGRTMWFADSATRRNRGFRIRSRPRERRDGARTVARTPPPGVPDGSCVDSEGFVWNAVWEGYRVERYAPDGRLDRVIEVPVRKPTCCAFGGKDLSTLFITTSRLGETPEDLAREPLAGALFADQARRIGMRGPTIRRLNRMLAWPYNKTGGDDMKTWNRRIFVAALATSTLFVAAGAGSGDRLSRTEAAEGRLAGRRFEACKA